MNKFLSNPLVIVIITLLAFSFVISLKKNANKANISSQNLTKLENEITKLENNLQQAQDDLNESKTLLSQEKIIRNQLLMQKPGEYVVQIPLPEEKQEKNLNSFKTTPLEEWKSLLLK